MEEEKNINPDPLEGNASSQPPQDQSIETVSAEEIEKMDKELYAQEEEEAAEIEEYVCKLTPGQQQVWQIILGWVFGFSIWFSLAISMLNPDNSLLSFLFVIIFAAAMFGRTAIERKTGVRLRVFMKHFLISLIVFLAAYIILGPVTGILSAP